MHAAPPGGKTTKAEKTGSRVKQTAKRPGPALRRLTLVPLSGMCNRLRAIASARRLCTQLGARCSVVWDWGDFWRFFAPLPDLKVVGAGPPIVDKQERHYPMRLDPNRTADVTVEHLELHSGYVFWGSHESPIKLAQIRPFLPSLCARLQQVVDAFAERHLHNTVGFHMRRTDSAPSIKHSPDALFFERAIAVIAAGKRIFLATDNTDTELTMRQRFGDSILTYPKRRPLDQRWPRAFDPIAVEDDLIDLFLLAKNEYVLGSYWSAFSGLAILLNSSEKCAILKVPDGKAVKPERRQLASAK
jgi:hypothetical protein